MKSSGSRADAAFVAIADREVVGYASLCGLSDGAAHRGEAGMARARDCNRPQALADRLGEAGRLQPDHNDEANAAMRGINERLGYVAEPASLLLRGPLA